MPDGISISFAHSGMGHDVTYRDPQRLKWPWHSMHFLFWPMAHVKSFKQGYSITPQQLKWHDMALGKENWRFDHH